MTLVSLVAWDSHDSNTPIRMARGRKLREVAEVEHGFGCPTVTSSRGNHVMQHRVRGTGAMEKDSC